MVDVQIKVDERLLEEVDRISKPLGLDRSEVVREALESWLHRHEIARFEKEWIAALQKNPDDPERAEDWIDVQAWSEK